MDTEQYLNFIRDALKNEGVRVADVANKLALDLKRITTDQYSAAARLIAETWLRDH